ncbi:MAG: NAD-dependent epimerase/dehydratase family protein [Planctomycetes bacterium]|nr:NAD-dependent epimerase/dehydratase family protein [Planctomycetota bacterium]
MVAGLETTTDESAGGPMKNIAIVGCGYVGSAFARAAAAVGHDVAGTTTTPERRPELEGYGMAPVVLQVSDRDALRAFLQGRDIVYLCVAAGRNRGDYRSVYVDGAANVLEAASAAGVSRIVYTSSTSVYGKTDGSLVTEESPIAPARENARLLVEAERILLDGGQRNGMAVTILRLAAIYGPGRDPTNWMRRSAGTQRHDGDALLNFVHVDDIATAMMRVLETGCRGVFNVCEDRPIRRRTLYDRLAQTTGCTPVTWVRGDDRQAGSPAVNLGKHVSNERIKRRLGMRFRQLEY